MIRCIFFRLCIFYKSKHHPYLRHFNSSSVYYVKRIFLKCVYFFYKVLWFDNYSVVVVIVVGTATALSHEALNVFAQASSYLLKAGLSLCVCMYVKTRSIQRTQTLPRLGPLTLSCDLTLLKYFMQSDVAYYIIPWYQVCVIVCEIWPLVHFLWPLTFVSDLHCPSKTLSL